MYTKLVDDYLSRNDWRVNENSNIGHTYGGLVNYISSSVMAKYWLEKCYNKEINTAHTNCDIHIHDLGYFCGYCNGIDLKTILLKGVSGVRGQTSSSPPNHFESALNMALTMLMLLQSEFAGAQAYSNFDTLLAPYIKKDNLTYEQVYQNLQNFVWSLNYPTRLGAQAPFTNLTFDVKVPKSYTKENPFIGNELMDFTYGDCQEEMNMINKAFMDIMVKGDSNGKGFPYPIPTYSITKDFDWDNPVLEPLFEMAGVYGIPYFQNLVNSSLNPEDIRSMCCFSGKEEIICKIDGKIKLINLYTLNRKKYKTLEVQYKGKWIEASPVKVNYDDDFYLVTLRNGKAYTMTNNHLNPTNNGLKRTDQLTTKDKLEYDTTPMIYDGVGGHNLGKFIGLYLAEGSHLGNDIQFSIHEDETDILEFITSFVSEYFAANVCVQQNTGKSISIFVNSSIVKNFIDRYVAGKAKNKKLINYERFNRVMLEGIFEGWMMGDGKYNKSEGYSTSKKLIQQLSIIASRIGYLTNIREYDRITKLGNKEYNSTIYTLHICDRLNGSIYKNIDNKLYVDIVKIEKIPNRQKVAFCVEILNDEPYFQLSDGLVTHNCRLSLDLKELRNMGGGLFGAEAKTGCYDNDTEVLTNNGWKYFKDIDEVNDKIYSMNDERNVELVAIDQYHEYDYDGELIHFKSKTSDLLVTPNHRMILDNHGKNVVELAENVTNRYAINIPMSKEYNYKGNSNFILNECFSNTKNIKYSKKEIPMELWAAFMGIYLSEGNCDKTNNTLNHGNQRYRVTISQKKSNIRTKIKELLSQLPWSVYEHENGFDIEDKQLCEYLQQFGNKYNKFIPEDLKKQPKHILEILWNWLLDGDGNRHKMVFGRKQATESYWTTSKSLNDDIQEILFYMGFASTSRVTNKKDVIIKGRLIKKENQKDCYIITKLIRKTSSIKNKDFKRVNYKGKVYCLTVKNGNMFVRRNGMVNWCGNSVGVVTINLARIGYVSKNKNEFFNRLEYLLNIAKDSLEIKRTVVTEWMDKGLYPYTKEYVGSFRTFFSTIGINGGNEMCVNFLGKDITTEEGKEFSLMVLDFIREKIKGFQLTTGHLYNLEQTPAESTAGRFARKDRKLYPEMIIPGGKDAYYTNSTHIPVDKTTDVFDVFEHQQDLTDKYTGGSVVHVFLGESITDFKIIKKLVKKLCKNYRVPYFTISPTYSVCEIHGFLKGECHTCPKCEEELNYYKRLLEETNE